MPQPEAGAAAGRRSEGDAEMQLSEVELFDPDVWVDGVPREAFAVLRREAPVFFHEEPGGPGFWVLSRYEDVRHVSKHPEIFSSAAGGTNIPTLDEDALGRMRAIMLNMDPPQHRQFRGIVNKAFTPRMVRKLVPRVEALAKRILDRVAPKGECDFVDEVAAQMPMEVICEMVGIPEEDRREIYDLSNRLIGFDDPDFRTSEEDGALAAAAIFVYAGKVAERARKHPGDDLATALLHAELDGQRLSELEFNSFFMLLAIAGNETTRTVTVNGLLDLLQHPDQLQALREDPSLIPSAVEEMLRFDPPVNYFRRTALRDTEIRGQAIREGDKVTLWYPSVNRDEEIFDDPERFEVRRDPNPHLSFGIGEHYCLGANLARMELRIIFREILERLHDVELSGPVRRLRSNFINGVKEMPVRFRPEPARS
jgi:cholest-4-en-3-one 26-monooxygenase